MRHVLYQFSHLETHVRTQNLSRTTRARDEISFKIHTRLHSCQIRTMKADAILFTHVTDNEHIIFSPLPKYHKFTFRCNILRF